MTAVVYGQRTIVIDGTTKATTDIVRQRDLVQGQRAFVDDTGAIIKSSGIGITAIDNCQMAQRNVATSLNLEDLDIASAIVVAVTTDGNRVFFAINGQLSC